MVSSVQLTSQPTQSCGSWVVMIAGVLTGFSPAQRLLPIHLPGSGAAGHASGPDLNTT